MSITTASAGAFTSTFINDYIFSNCNMRHIKFLTDALDDLHVPFSTSTYPCKHQSYLYPPLLVHTHRKRSSNDGSDHDAHTKHATHYESGSLGQRVESLLMHLIPIDWRLNLPLCKSSAVEAGIASHATHRICVLDSLTQILRHLHSPRRTV